MLIRCKWLVRVNTSKHVSLIIMFSCNRNVFAIINPSCVFVPRSTLKFVTIQKHILRLTNNRMAMNVSAAFLPYLIQT